MNEIAKHSGLSNQFAVSCEPIPGYRCNLEIGGWFVGYDDRYALTRILDEHGEFLGAFLGAVVDIESNAFKPVSVRLRWAKGSDRKTLEDCLYRLAGSWIAIIVTADMQSIYLDACGSVPFVYFSNRKLAGSSADALLSDRDYLADLYDEARAETWFTADWYHTAGLTAHRSLRRLLPNHRLNVENWTVERIWPVEPFFTLAVEQVVDDVAEAARNTINAAMRCGHALVPLTAGNETRALLSLVGNKKSDATFFTGSFPGAVVDLGTARRLAKQFGLSHVITDVRARTKDEVETWRRRTGHCVGGAIGFSKMDREKISGGVVEFSGAAGEVGRGFLWSIDDLASSKLSSEILLTRLKLPRIERLVVAVNDWLASVEQFDTFTVMDLAYIELKMACWAGPQATGSETDVAQIWPFSSRRCFAAMMSAPTHVRLEQSLFRRIVEREWPELLEIPINKGTASENLRKLIYRASSPRRIWSKLRKSFAKMKPAKEIE